VEKKLVEAVQNAIENDKDNQIYFKAYDDIDNLNWALPRGWESKDWIRKRVSTDGHDALRSLASLFDTHNPKWEILPRGEADKDAAEELETWLEWHMKRANQIGEKSPFRKALHNAGKYNRVVLQVDYLPYWLPEKKKWTPEQKAAAKAGPFCITVHNPRNVYYDMGKYGLKWVASVTKLYGYEIINHWSAYEGDNEEGKKVKSSLSKIRKEIEKDPKTCYIHVDFTSYEKRTVACFKAETIEQFSRMAADAEHFTIVDSENKLSFIPWTVVTGDSDPLLHSLHLGGAWENQNLIETIVDSSVLRRAFAPLLKHRKQVGVNKELDIDFSGNEAVVELEGQEDADYMSPPPIDPALSQLSGSNASRMSSSLGMRNLQSMEMSGNVQYSTLNAFIQLQMARLEPYKRTAEKAWEQAAEIMFYWVKETGDKLTAYRTKSKNEQKMKGMSLVVGPEDFEIEDLHIQCDLIANTPTDKMQQVNMYSALKGAGAQIGWGDLLERLGMGNPEILKQDWMNEQLEGVALQNYVEKLKAEIQMEIQAKQMEMQNQMQQQQQMQQMEMQQQAQGPQNAVIPNGQMNDPAAGGLPPMMSAPGMTQNQVMQ